MPSHSKVKKVVRAYSPPKFKVQVNCILDIEEPINGLFNAILKDYCRRFNVRIKKGRGVTRIMFTAAHGSEAGEGLCAGKVENGPALFIQTNCIALEGWELNRYTVGMFYEVIAHEFVHACQYLTGRSGMTVEGNYAKTPEEEYYFDQEEVEARVLQAFYCYTDLTRPYLKTISMVLSESQSEPGEFNSDLISEM